MDGCGIVTVDGPVGSGKTTFVEHVLRAAGGWIRAVRCRRESRVDWPCECSLPDHPEVRRYLSAGADAATVYRVPWCEFGMFSCLDLLEYRWDVVIEGERPLERPDLGVFVAPAPAPRCTVLRRVGRDIAGEREGAVSRLVGSLDSPGGVARVVEGLLGAAVARFVERRPEIAIEFRSRIRTALRRLGSVKLPAESGERWELTEPYRGIEHARLVVINARGPSERARADAAREEVLRLCRDPDVFDDVVDWRGYRVPITVVVADLSDERDPGLLKAIRRTMRALHR